MRLILVLGDQLSHNLSSLTDADPTSDVILMCELKEEAVYVKHHKKKIALIFSAMRHFAQELADRGFDVRYTRYGDPKNTGSFRGEVERHLSDTDAKQIIVTCPGEYRLLTEFQSWTDQLNADVVLRDDDRFLCKTEDFNDWAKGRKQLRMEYSIAIYAANLTS